ncbi:unnamed protein product [Schistosoma mattheei]|uniref:Uncharacterized protein n=1 Tax=Schistosoma mattheei TaxID=31246 RepID=A0A183NS94_9TREM|nr:unnamed protein product [Schistosoma mattheei]
MQLNDLDFTDDLALLSHTQQQMQEKTNSVAAVGHNIHKGKSKIIRYNTTGINRITFDEALEDVKTFTYLGRIIDENGGSDADVNARIGKVGAAYLQPDIWNFKQLSTANIKVTIFNTNAKTAQMFGAETWRTTKATIQKIQLFTNSCLRKILRIRWPDIISNNLLWERTNQIPAEEELLEVDRTRAEKSTQLSHKASSHLESSGPKNTSRRKMKTDLRRMNKSWTELERKAQDRVGILKNMDTLSPRHCLYLRAQWLQFKGVNDEFHGKLLDFLQKTRRSDAVIKGDLETQVG